MKILCITVIVLLCFSCSQSQTKSQAIQSVIDYCECKVEKIEIADNKAGKKTIELSLSENKNLKFAEMASSMSAFRYFGSLSENDQNDINKINITIDYREYEKDAIHTFTYTNKQLKLIHNKFELLTKHLKFIYGKDYRSFINSCDKEASIETINRLEDFFKTEDSLHGEMVDFSMSQFSFFKENKTDSTKLVNIVGQIKRTSGIQNFIFNYYDDMENELIREFRFE